MDFVDTNILLYAIGRDASSRGKRQIARDLLSAPNLAISVQVLGEFFVNAIRPGKGGLSDEEAGLRCWVWSSCFRVAGLGVTTFSKALENRSRFQLSYWDSLILASAQELGCSSLLTEDLNAGQDYGGVVARNPFGGM